CEIFMVVCVLNDENDLLLPVISPDQRAPYGSLESRFDRGTEAWELCVTSFGRGANEERAAVSALAQCPTFGRATGGRAVVGRVTSGRTTA
ncbi:hypothetical protein HPB47_006857, partial [Ixodes persulcatus]